MILIQKKIIKKYRNLPIVKDVNILCIKMLFLKLFLLSIITSTISTVQASITYSDIDLAQSLSGLGYEVN